MEGSKYLRLGLRDWRNCANTVFHAAVEEGIEDSHNQCLRCCACRRWNACADQWNQWAELSEDEKVIAIEALALGARKERVFELKEKWGLTDDDAQELVKRLGLQLFKDGNQWCAAELNFINLQESQAGFGNTCLEALADFAKQGELE